MSTSTLHPDVSAYLKQVRREGRDLPPDRLAELLVDLEQHLAAVIAPDASEEDAREALRRFGDPAEIVAAERPHRAPPARPGTREWAAIFLLLLGFFVVGVGWIAGVVLLWSSRVWTTKDKLIGTLVLPGGLVASLLLVLLAQLRGATSKCVYLGARLLHCTHGASMGPSTAASIALMALALTPLASAVYLARRAR